MAKKVLIIDDGEDIRFLMKRFLHARHFSVTEAGDLETGLELYKRLQPDIVILDANLPDGSGVNNAKKFKKNDEIVIFVSADSQLSENYKALGADGFLKKPFDANDLLTVIDQSLFNAQLNP